MRGNENTLPRGAAVGSFKISFLYPALLVDHATRVDLHGVRGA